MSPFHPQTFHSPTCPFLPPSLPPSLQTLISLATAFNDWETRAQRVLRGREGGRVGGREGGREELQKLIEEYESLEVEDEALVAKLRGVDEVRREGGREGRKGGREEEWLCFRFCLSCIDAFISLFLSFSVFSTRLLRPGKSGPKPASTTWPLPPPPLPPSRPPPPPPPPPPPVGVVVSAMNLLLPLLLLLLLLLPPPTAAAAATTATTTPTAPTPTPLPLPPSLPPSSPPSSTKSKKTPS